MWKVRDAKERSDACYDQTCAQKVVNRDAVRQELCDKHLQSPLALDEAVRRIGGMERRWLFHSRGDQDLSVFFC